MSDYSQGLAVGDKVRIDSIAWGENSQWVGQTGVVTVIDRRDYNQPIKVKFKDTNGVEREEWVKTASKAVPTVLELKKAIYEKAKELQQAEDWCDETDRFLRDLGAMPTVTFTEPKQGSVVGFDNISGHYVYRRMTGYRDGERSWVCTGDEDDYTWAQLRERHPHSTFRVLFEPTPGVELPPAVEKIETWA